LKPGGAHHEAGVITHDAARSQPQDVAGSCRAIGDEACVIIGWQGMADRARG
jgi:hypothetical protein